MLQVRELKVSIASVEALRGFSIDVAEGSMVGLVGRNGAGKTSLMRAVMGHLRLGGGSVSFGGADLARRPPHARAGLGIGYMPEDRGLVPELTVEENILLPVWTSKTLDAKERLKFVYGAMPELEAFAQRRALLLSGGQQKLAALGRALAVGTKLLLLDEPFEGLAPALSKRLADVIAGLRGRGLAVLLSQSDLNHSRSLLDREVVIERGANRG